MGTAFRPGVHEPVEPFLAKERRIAEHLVATDRASVHKRPDDHTKHRVTNPDAIVRNDGDDPGRFTEFKTLTNASAGAVKNHIMDAGKQLAHHGGGDVVIDGRDVKLDEATARKGYARAMGQARAHPQAVPQRVRVILGDGRTVDLGGQ